MNSNGNSKIFNEVLADTSLTTFAQLKETIKMKKIREQAIEIIVDNHKVGMQTVATKLKVTKKTLEESLDVTPEKKEGFLESLGIQKTLGMGLGLEFLFKSMDGKESLIEKGTRKFADNFEEHVIDNELFLMTSAGMYLAWKQIIAPRIDDPKNETSELEFISQFLDSKVGAVISGGYLLTFLVPFLFSKLEPAFDTVIDVIAGIFTEITDALDGIVQTADNAGDVLGSHLGDLDCNGKSYPDLFKWLKSKSWRDQLKMGAATILTGGAAAPWVIAKYEKEKFDWAQKNCE